MPKPKTLLVYADPWHGPLDHNHRACTAVPFDPDDHNPNGGLVGAHRRLDPDGELYFEFDQFDHETHELLPGAEPILLPETHRYKQAIRHGELVAADVATFKAVFGTETGFVAPAQVLAWSKEGRLAQHQAAHGEPRDPKPVPPKGKGLVGASHVHTITQAVSPVRGNPKLAAERALEQFRSQSNDAQSGDVSPKAGE